MKTAFTWFLYNTHLSVALPTWPHDPLSCVFTVTYNKFLSESKQHLRFSDTNKQHSSTDTLTQHNKHTPWSKHLQVNIMFHQPHPTVPRPTLTIVIPDNVLIIRIRVFSEVSLNKVTSFLRCEPAGSDSVIKGWG